MSSPGILAVGLRNRRPRQVRARCARVIVGQARRRCTDHRRAGGHCSGLRCATDHIDVFGDRIEGLSRPGRSPAASTASDTCLAAFRLCADLRSCPWHQPRRRHGINGQALAALIFAMNALRSTRLGTCVVYPPTTASTWPVMKSAQSDARNATARATSIGAPRRI